MIFFLAEATTDFPVAGIGWLVVGIASVCVAANQVDDFFERRKTKEQLPPNGELHLTGEENRKAIVALRQEFTEGRNSRDQEIRKIYAHMADDRMHGDMERKRSSAAIYNKIDQTRKEVEDNINQVKETIRTLPNEFMALLKNTKNL